MNTITIIINLKQHKINFVLSSFNDFSFSQFVSLSFSSLELSLSKNTMNRR